MNKSLLSDEECWQAVVRRDGAYDGAFVTAVLTTKIYCRPTCPSRHPKRENVTFFAAPQDAKAAGFRACLRCQPDEECTAHAELAERICEYLAGELESAPTLDQLGERFHLSPFHLQRIFKRVTGVTPRQYYDAHRREQFKAQLKDGEGVTAALYDAGYTSNSQLYPGTLGMTPTAYRKGGAGQHIRYTIAACSLGFLLVAATERGLCVVRLGDDAADLLTRLRGEYHAAELVLDADGLGAWVTTILDSLDRQPQGTALYSLPLDIQATAFQRRVWEALRAIPIGETRSYTEIAAAIGQPTAARAVAQACASNPVAVLIPCHRVVRENGNLGGYRWGVERKQKLLMSEGAASDQQPPTLFDLLQTR